MMTTGQAASYLDVSTCTLREWVKKGYIPVVMKTPTGYLKFAEYYQAHYNKLIFHL